MVTEMDRAEAEVRLPAGQGNRHMKRLVRGALRRAKRKALRARFRKAVRGTGTGGESQDSGAEVQGSGT